MRVLLLDLSAATSDCEKARYLFFFQLFFLVLAFFFQMETLSEPDHVSVPDRTRSPSDPSVVATVAATSAGTGSDGCDPCPLPRAADPLSAPAAADPPEIPLLKSTQA